MDSRQARAWRLQGVQHTRRCEGARSGGSEDMGSMYQNYSRLEVVASTIDSVRWFDAAPWTKGGDMIHVQLGESLCSIDIYLSQLSLK